MLVPADVMESLFWQAAGPLISDDDPSAVMLAGMMVCAADGMLVNLPDTPENRALFGCTGTAEQDGEGSAPFPAGQGHRADRPRRAGDARARSWASRRPGSRPVRHHAIRSMTFTQITGSSSLDALAAAADTAARAALHTLSVPGRQRHSKRAQKARPKFPHATATKATVTGKPEVTVFAPGFS